MGFRVPTPILYGYERRWLSDAARFKVWLSSRQIGKTFTATLEAVLDCVDAEAAGKTSKWTILSVSQARASDAIEDGVKLHLRALKAAFEAAETRLDSDELAYEVRLARGSRIRCVAARPATARGMTENLILDEFAHHQDNRAIWTALLPVVSRPDLKLRVISTPAGKGDKFHELVTDPVLGRMFSRHVVTIHDAVADGLPRDIDELKAAMNDPEAWAQEFECQFVDEASSWLPYDLIAACEEAAAGEAVGYAGGPVYFGVDFAVRGDLTVIAVLEDVDGVLWLREMIELARASFAAQLAEIDRVMREYHVIRAALDQTGLGEMPVEETKRRHGAYRIEGVLFSAARKLELATALKQRMEDRALRLPPRRELRDDLHSVKRVVGPTGAPRLVALRAGGSHADRFWALALAAAAAANPPAVFAYDGLARQPEGHDPMRADERDDDMATGGRFAAGAW